METVKLSGDIRYQFKCYAIDDNSVVISVTPPNEVYLTGIINVKVVYGLVDLMGYKLTPKKSYVTVHSVKEYCLLKIISQANETCSPIDESYLASFNICGDVSRAILSQFSTTSQLILISKHEKLKNVVQFVLNYDLPLFVGENFEKPLKNFFPVDSSKCYSYQERREWKTATDVILSRKHAKTVLCGGKGTGKTTLLKYLINKSLDIREEVLIIDFDPGQPEFTVPGCLSATIIRSPLLGPNFSHSTIPTKCLYLSTVDVMNSPNQYTHYVKNLIDYCYAHFDTGIPWFVNTMGFIQGAGIKFLLHIINNVNPSDVIQIMSSKNESCNLYRRLSSSTSATKKKNVNTSFQLHSFPSFTKSVRNQSNASVCCANPLTRRNITTLFYFKRAMKNISDTCLLAIVPHSLSLKKVKIIVDKPSSHELQISLIKFQSLCSINGKMVALCVTDITDDTLQCIGYGIVRGFDPATDELYISTPVDSDHFSMVEIICASLTIQLPETVYRNRKSFSGGAIPYLMYRRVDRFNQKTKKSTSRLKYRTN